MIIYVLCLQIKAAVGVCKEVASDISHSVERSEI